MSIIDGKTCRLCRSAGKKLFLKGERCHSAKCPMHAQLVPGARPTSRMRTPRKRRVSDYGIQLREKQNLKRLYVINEKTLRRYFDMALKTKMATSEVMVSFLESRLDNVVYRLGFAASRQMAHQIVGHRHVTVDGKIVNIPSFQVKPGMVIAIDSTIAKNTDVKRLVEDKSLVLPEWVQRKALVGKFIRCPTREEISLDVNEQLIIEFYSR